MLLELAIADAYGAGFEYADEMIVNNDLSRYVEHPRFRLIPGTYTDVVARKLDKTFPIISL
ncbi:hypothetical protein PQG02_19970 [Nostoc sp. UHCC 0926]|nr:hypothetical protein PQG02_19970 [Nostoc sp. UHCC 0926]